MWQEPKNLGHPSLLSEEHLQGSGWELENLELKFVLIWIPHCQVVSQGWPQHIFSFKTPIEQVRGEGTLENAVCKSLWKASVLEEGQSFKEVLSPQHFILVVYYFPLTIASLDPCSTSL